jgi:hypothetical protein
MSIHQLNRQITITKSFTAAAAAAAEPAALVYNLAGTLPSEWSALPKDLYVGLMSNSDVTGTIPASFASNQGAFYNLYSTSITGCVPAGLVGDFRTLLRLDNGTEVLQDLPPCTTRSG